jgi:hypothetical protein
MELKKVLETLRANAAQYVRAFAEILTSPRLYFVPETRESNSGAEPQVVGAEGPNQKEKTLSNANLLVFGAISVFLGSAVWQYLLGREDSLPLAGRVAIVLVLWCLIGAGAHVVCRIVGGKGSAIDTLAGTIQTLAVTYVIGTLLTLLLVGKTLGARPQLLYAAIQCALLLALLPPILGRIHRLTRSRAAGLLVVPLFASALSFLVWNGRLGAPRATSPELASARSPVMSLAGSPEPGPSAGGDILPARGTVPQLGQVFIRYFQPQSAQPPHVSFVENKADSTQVFWFPLRECESERKCPYRPWWRKADVNVIVVPDDVVVGIMELHNTCYGLLRVNPDSDYSMACQGQRLRVVTAPTTWRSTGQPPRTEWLAARWPLNP